MELWESLPGWGEGGTCGGLSWGCALTNSKHLSSTQVGGWVRGQVVELWDLMIEALLSEVSWLSVYLSCLFSRLGRRATELKVSLVRKLIEPIRTLFSAQQGGPLPWSVLSRGLFFFQFLLRDQLLPCQPRLQLDTPGSCCFLWIGPWRQGGRVKRAQDL